MKEDDLKYLGPALRYLRIRSGLKQRDIANGAGVTKAMISSYESGGRDPSLRSLFRVLQTLDCTLVELHDAMLCVRGNMLVFPVDVVIPLWARPLLMEVLKLIVAEVAASEGTTGEEGS